MSRDVDPLLERINGVLAECDASKLPPLASEPAAAVLDLAEQAGFELTPWQEWMVRSMYVPKRAGAAPMQYATTTPADSDSSIVAQLRARAADQPRSEWEWWSPEVMIVDEVADFVAERPRSWWRRWWSR